MIRGLPASVPARGLDPWRRPKGSWALGTRMALGMTILTTTEKFEFLSIEDSIEPVVLYGSTKSCSGPSKSSAISGKPGALKGTSLRSCLSCRSCSEERLSLYFAHGFWICILPD